MKFFFLAQIGHGYGEIQGISLFNNKNKNNSSSNLIILSQKTRTYPRFKVTGRETCVKFKQPKDKNVDMNAWLESCVKDLENLLLKSVLPSDYIGFEIRSENLTKPLWLSFRPVTRFNSKDIVSLIECVAQSSTSFDVGSDVINVLSSIICILAGRVRVSLTALNLFDVNKSSILKLKREQDVPCC